LTQVKQAIMAMTQTRFPAIFLRFETFATLGKMTSHEELRDRGALAIIDTYDDLMEFTGRVPTVFISHQWLGFGAPDPENIHYKAILASVKKLAKEELLDEAQVYIWLDYCSIPQANSFMQAMAIDSLGVYASACRYFVVIAPQAMHRDKGILCDHDTYAKRGW